MGVLVKTSLFICILWGIHIWIKQVIDTEENNQKMEETLENMNHSYVEFQGKISEARKYRHDIPKHLHMMEQAVSDIIDDEYSVDTMLNAIACVTEEKCQEYNIQIKINLAIKESEIFDKLNIEKVDLSELLQNLLDNAIEECCRISEDFERKILWTMNTTEYGVKIRVENTCCNIKKYRFYNGKKEDKKCTWMGRKNYKGSCSEGRWKYKLYKRRGRQYLCGSISSVHREFLKIGEK